MGTMTQWISVIGAGLLVAAYTTTTTTRAAPVSPASAADSLTDWAGDVRGTGANSFIGGKAIVVAAGRDSTKAAILLLGADTLNVHPWRIRHNECATATGKVTDF